MAFIIFVKKTRLTKIYPMNKQILFIDNDIASYILVSELLADYNFEITHSKCGLYAVKLFKQNPLFDLVVTELKLPSLDGFGVLKEIRKIKPEIPVIVQTAHVINNMKYSCLAAGFNEFIDKPIDLKFFTCTVNKYIQNQDILHI